MDRLELFRRRLIPNENIALTDDVIRYMDSACLVTQWETFRKKKDFSHGSSAYFFHLGIKLSKFYNDDNELVYWYCDFVDYIWENEDTKLTVLDLLADVILYPDGHVDVVDLDELSEAFEKDLISKDQLMQVLKRVDWVLRAIKSGEFDNYKRTLETYE